MKEQKLIEFRKKFVSESGDFLIGDSDEGLSWVSDLIDDLNKTHAIELATAKSNHDQLKQYYEGIIQEASDTGTVEASMVCNEKTLPKAVEEEREKTIKILKELKNNRNGRKKYFGTEPYTDKGYNTALEDAITKIKQ